MRAGTVRAEQQFADSFDRLADSQNLIRGLMRASGSSYFPSPDESSPSKNASVSGSSVSIRPTPRRGRSPDGVPR
jgi:hypothetical protein